MSPRNPIDDFFRRRLATYEEAPPMHRWEEIAALRDRQQRRDRRRFGMSAGASMLLLAIIAAWWALPPNAIVLRSFPIPLESSEPRVIERLVVEPLARLSEPSPPGALRSSLPATRSSVQPASPSAGTQELAADDSFAAPDQANDRRRMPHYSVHELPRILPLPIHREPQCMRFGEPQRWKLYADAFVGPAYGFRRMEAREPRYDDYASARAATEKAQLSFTTGLRISAVSDFGLALRTGLQYTQFNERFDYSENREEKITITNVYGPNGDFIRTDTIVEKSVQHLQAANRYRMLDIPILLGYELRRNKWTIAFNGGALINVLFSGNGQFLAPEDGQPVAFSSGSEDDSYQAMKTNIGLGWYAGIGLHYHLRHDLQLLLEPHLRYNPQSVTRGDFPLQQRYLGSGLSIGLRKQI